MMEIQPQHVTLHTLLGGRRFRIPQYQRSCSWRSEERKDLVGDIGRIWAAGEDRDHFIATIVGLRLGTRTIITTEHQVIDVVDVTCPPKTGPVINS